jgi:hypothetical protein
MSTTGREVRFQNIHLKSTAIFYWGTPTGTGALDEQFPDGSWKWQLVSGDLVFYKRINDAWVERAAIT